MRRREFMSLIGGAAAAWPFAARAEQNEPVRHVGMLLTAVENDPEYQPWIKSFLQGLQDAGWAIGHTLRIDTRWAPNAGDIRKSAEELVALAPDVILAPGAAAVGPLLRLTRTVPIVFPIIADPVAAGFVDSLARPGGNSTGFMLFEYSISGKWLELLKQIAPGVTRVAVLGDTTTPTGPAQFGIIQAVAPLLRVEVIALNKLDTDDLERAIAAFAQIPNGALIVTASRPALVHRDQIISLAARHNLPAIYFERLFVADGGLVSYGPDRIDLYRRAAGYVDRILKGEKPADLPVQTPTRYQLVLNLKTAKALGLIIPPTLLDRADEVIE